MRSGVAVLLLVLGSASGCASAVYAVSQDPASGVPFLPVESVDSRVERYGQAWFEVELATEVVPAGTAPADVPRLKVTRSLLAYTDNELAAATLVGAFNDAESPEQAARAVEAAVGKGGWTRVPPPPRDLARDDWSAGLPLLSVSRTRTQQPAGQPRYFNVRVPMGGNGTGALQLAANGTLTQASGEVHDALPGAVVSGLGSVLSSAVPGVLSALFPTVLAPRPGPSVAVLAARIRSTPWRRTYTVTTEWSATLGEGACPRGKRGGSPDDALVCRVSVGVELTHAGPLLPGEVPPAPPAPPPAAAPAAAGPR